MSCNIKRIKGCEIAGSTFNGRKLSLNRDISNDTFKAKVKTFNQKSIAEITGVKNATDVYFPFNGLENLSAGLYLIEYWGNFDDIGNELFCVEEFSVVAPSKAGEVNCCESYNVFNFVTEDVTIDIQITPTIVNIGDGDISKYYTKSETYSKIEIDELLDSIEVTKTELDVLISENKLEPDRLYKITGVESWSFSQHLVKAIYLKAITNNTLETTGFGEFYNVEYSSAPVWAGNLLEAGLIDSLEYVVDDHVIWGNLLWKNISGAIGTNLKNYGEDYGDISLPNYLSDSDWLLLTPQESGYYNLSIDTIKYDIENDYISYREDTLGNKYEQSFDNLVRDYPNYEIVDFDESYRYYVGGISLFHWGEPDTVYGNTIKNSLVLNCNNSSNLFLTNSFYNNTFENSFFYDNLVISSSIRNNKVLNSYFFYNQLKGSTIKSNEYNNSSFSVNRFDTVVFDNNKLLSQSNFGSNIFKDISVGFNTLDSSFITNNNLKSPNQGSNVSLYKNTLYDSSIQSNMYYIDIAFNTLNNGSSIANNIDNEITVYNRISTITKNNLDNNSTINSNNFVEEGKGISGFIKSINDNILNNTCNINSNIVKNGSRIFGHTMDYYSTINGNTLDTDSNIYTNQVIQNGKIDNNILTGHGRIYGNQLDRLSEITNCKLRISPATSYATTMKSNRLFAGKIQNIDFGDIVNPVGSNPNDPAFGGNALSECIIENGSIIKDLTFPNRGGVGIHFVKMNGNSELKNITVNNKIIGVEFINTVFNETSDYNKLIETEAYLGNGYTRFYIDNKLIVLSKLNETFLPYTGATKNVNIGSYFFESSQGFKKTGGSANQSLTANGGVFDLNTKADLVGGKIPSSQLPSYVDDVLEFANLASFPATGESGKIYIAIDTNLTYRWGGSSYVVMSSSLVLGETPSTAYRGDRGKTAYDHSQATGNPHNTKVEELTDVGSETTSIIDTDVILKKEVVGEFWRKITWTNIKSALKTYFDSLYAPKSFNVKVTTPSSWVTGTLSETEIYRFSIPANTISSESILSIESMLFNKIGVNGAFQVRMKLTTSATMPTGSTEQIARTPNMAANTRAAAIRRKFYVNGDVIKSHGFDSGLYYDEINVIDVISTRTLDRTQTYNVIISVTLANASDQVRLEVLDFNIK